MTRLMVGPVLGDRRKAACHSAHARDELFIIPTAAVFSVWFFIPKSQTILDALVIQNSVLAYKKCAEPCGLARSGGGMRLAENQCRSSHDIDRALAREVDVRDCRCWRLSAPSIHLCALNRFISQSPCRAEQRQRRGDHVLFSTARLAP